ncbi:MAG: sigma-70 family RNA polymerase sigma factor [Bacteroidota bacterium]
MNKQPSHTQIPDAVLVTCYKESGDQHYLAALFQRYAGLLFGVCLKYLKAPDAAQDACTDIYEELVKKVLKHEINAFGGWLHMVAKNHCLQKLRSSKNVSTTEISEQFMQLDEPMHLEEVLNKEVKLDLMEKCLEQLTNDQKQMVELFYLQEKSYKEISEMTGTNWNMVRSHIQNGRRNLKNCMEENSGE